MYQILDGKELARKIREELKLKVDKLKENGIVPKLAVILVGDDSASKVYVKNKSKACQDVGVEFEEILLDENTSMERLLEIIEKLNNREDINGILLQSPIPKGLNIQEAFEKIHCKKDVDGFNPVNVGKLMIGEDTFISCTPYGIIKMLEAYNIEIEGKHAVVIGRSNIVGKPLAQCLLQKNATVTICHSKTKNIAEITKNKKKIIVLNKCDLSDDKQNKLWIEYFKKKNIPAVLVDSNSGRGIDECIRQIEKIMQVDLEAHAEKGRTGRKIRAMILGIPNVGKSSFINRI